MADEQDKPVASAPPPPPPPPTETVAAPRRDRWGAVRGLVALTWVQLLAAGLIGGLVGGGIVALFAGGDDHHGRLDRVMMVDGQSRGGGRLFDQGPGGNRGWPAPFPHRWRDVQPNAPTPVPVPPTVSPSSPASPTPTKTS